MMLENDLPKGLLNWYPWRENAKAICIGKDTECIAEDLQRRGLMVSRKKQESAVDYILIMSELERADDPVSFIQEAVSGLKSDGHLFLAVENRLGLRYFCGDRDSFTQRNFDGVEGYRNFTEDDRHYFGGRHYAKSELEDILDRVGVGHRRFYSVLPGLEMPQQMYAEGYYPEEELAIRYTPLYHNPSSVFLSEERLYTSLIKNGMFHQMANAYLIDCSMDGKFYEINHVTTSVDRGPEDAMATIIWKNGFVEKKALYPEGKYKIQVLMNNTQCLQEHGIQMVPLKLNANEDGVIMPYMRCETALTYLRKLIYEDKELFIIKVEQYMNCILQSSEIDEEASSHSELGLYFKEVYIDMVPLNCFYQDGKFVFFDQEFCEKSYPVNSVLVRALDILYMADRGMEVIVPKEYFMKKYGLVEKYNALASLGNQYITKLRNSAELTEFYAKHRADATVVNSNRLRMNYSAEEYQKIFVDFMKDVEDKELYIFGSGTWARKFIAEYGDRYQIRAALDNNEYNCGKVIDGIEVKNPSILKELEAEKCKVIVCVKYYTSILVQLQQLGVKHYGLYDPYVEASHDISVSNIVEQVVRETVVGENEEKKAKKYKVGYIAGVFDLFHVGHLNMFRRAKEQCEYLIVGVVSDEQARKNKNKSPYVNEKERLQIVESNKYVDRAFLLPYVSAGTRDVYKKYHFDVQFSGSDYEHDSYWLAEQKWLRDRGSDLVFFPYTQSTSSTKLKKAIEKD